jgi:hypothetical protein
MPEPLARADFDAICLLVCPHCAAGDPARLRASTGEWVHSTHRVIRGGGAFSHGICWAHGLRNSAYAAAPEPGDKPPPMAP